MDTQDREKYRQLRQQQRERQLHIIRLSILLGVGVILMFTGLGLLTYVHQQKQTATSGNVSERFSEAASSAALETASRNDLDTETLELLEELLTDYSGTVLVVSHDRRFLDNLVTSVITLEGDGRAREYVGAYTDWLRQRPAPSPAQNTEEPPRQRQKRPAAQGRLHRVEKLPARSLAPPRPKPASALLRSSGNSSS